MPHNQNAVRLALALTTWIICKHVKVEEALRNAINIRGKPVYTLYVGVAVRCFGRATSKFSPLTVEVNYLLHSLPTMRFNFPCILWFLWWSFGFVNILWFSQKREKNKCYTIFSNRRIVSSVQSFLHTLILLKKGKKMKCGTIFSNRSIHLSAQSFL